RADPQSWMTKVTRSRTSRASSRASRKRRCSTNRYEAGTLVGSVSESPMAIRSGAMQRPNDCKCGNTLRQRYDEVGLPCSSTMGSPSPTSTYAISLPRTRRRCFLYGNAAKIFFVSDVVEIMFAPPLVVDDHFVKPSFLCDAGQHHSRPGSLSSQPRFPRRASQARSDPCRRIG